MAPNFGKATEPKQERSLSKTSTPGPGAASQLTCKALHQLRRLLEQSIFQPTMAVMAMNYGKAMAPNLALRSSQIFKAALLVVLPISHSLLKAYCISGPMMPPTESNSGKATAHPKGQHSSKTSMLRPTLVTSVA